MSYKLIYFNGRGRAELIRYIFAQAGVDYEDVRITIEEFMKMKPTLFTGSLPVLEVNGKQLSGSGPIARMLAEDFGMTGKDSIERAEIGGIIDVMDDLTTKTVPAFFGNDETKKEEAKKALVEEFIPKYFGIFEKRIATTNSPAGYIYYSDKPTYADLRLSILFDALVGIIPSIADDYPNMNRLSTTVRALPKIAEWLKKRPETPF